MDRRRPDLLLGCLPLLLLACDAGAPPIPPTCNGHEALCARRYDEVAYATTHNAMSNSDEGWLNANQRHGLTRQLEDGVRALMLDVWEFDGGVYLCHAFCQLGKTELAAGLREIRDFLDDHRGEVVTIIFESYVSVELVEAAFADSGLDRHVHAQPAGAPWPTLRELVDADARVVVFTDKDGGARPWYLDVWAFAFETHYHFESVAELSCAPNRGDPARSLFILNHFLTGTIGGSPELAEMVNHAPLLPDRAAQCQAERGLRPNFVTVDYYDIGDLFAVVDGLNGVAP
jgi:hypothetical protein